MTEKNKITIVEKLITDLKNDDWMVRKSAVVALSKILASSDRDLDIREKASKALKEFTGHEVG